MLAQRSTIIVVIVIVVAVILVALVYSQQQSASDAHAATATPQVTPTLTPPTSALPTVDLDVTPVVIPIPEDCTTYVVQAGDTLASIAAQYDVSMDDLREINGISKDDTVLLQIGDMLLIPMEECPVLIGTPALPVGIPTLSFGAPVATPLATLGDQGGTAQ